MKIDKRIIATALLAISITMALTIGTFGHPTVADTDTSGEVWVTAQAPSQLLILHPRDVLEGISSPETVQLPLAAHPHITTFSPDGNFAYVADMGDGQLRVIRAQDRQPITTLNLSPLLTHQAKASPDGTTLLVANIANKTLFKVAADEAALSWTVTGSLSFASISKAPICSVFRDDGLRAYVSLLPSGIAVVDVPTMTLLGTFPTDGFIACGMIKSQDGHTVFIASNGSGGHLYLLDTTTDTLTDTGHTLGAGSWHSFNIDPTETVGYGTSPALDQLQVINLATGTATPLALNPTAGIGNDQPDAIAVQGNNVYVTLRFAGELAVINTQNLKVQYIQLEPTATSVNPANCMGCAIHGVAIRPQVVTSTTVALVNQPSTIIDQMKLANGNAKIRMQSLGAMNSLGSELSWTTASACGCCCNMMPTTLASRDSPKNGGF